MFKNVIYFNNKRISEYSSTLKKERYVDYKKVTTTSSKSMGGGVPKVVSGEYAKTTEMEGEVVESLSFECEEFELLLEKHGGDYYFDVSEDPELVVDTMPKSAIIRFDGEVNIPEEFDMMQLINDFKPMLVSGVDVGSDEEQEIFNNIFGKENTKIPVFLNSDSFEESLGFSKLNTNHLIADYGDLEDLEDEDVTIIAKIQSRKKSKGKPIVLFDIMKDLFSLSRAMRRQAKTDDSPMEGLENITSEQNIVTLEVLAIYQ